MSCANASDARTFETKQVMRRTTAAETVLLFFSRAKSLFWESTEPVRGALKLSEAARIALLQEVMRDAKRNERAGLLVCVIGVVVSVTGFSTTSLAENSMNLGIVGIVIAAIGFILYLYFARVYLRYVGQLASMTQKSAMLCPRCAKALPEGEYAFCPFCGSPLKS